MLDLKIIGAICDISIVLKSTPDIYEEKEEKVFMWDAGLQEIHVSSAKNELFILDSKGAKGKNLSHKKFLLLQGIASFYGLTLEMGFISLGD